jgi:hypothetical protein
MKSTKIEGGAQARMRGEVEHVESKAQAPEAAEAEAKAKADVFAGTVAHPVSAPKADAPRGASALIQAIGLRAKKSEPRTEGAKTSLLGLALSRVKRALRPVTLGTAALLITLSLSVTNSVGQTLYVNVNGAKPMSAEVVGAKRAAQQAGERFIEVTPSQLESVLATANEPGGKIRKLAVSGHSSGGWISGSDASGQSHSLSLSEMQKLAEKYPRAFSTVESFYGMACNIGTEEYSRQWMELFPNNKALVGFDNIGPSSDRPAAGNVIERVDARLRTVSWQTLTRDRAMQLAREISNLPGVNVTEFSIRLRANDGSTIFYSKKNRPTSVSTAADLVNQLRAGAFIRYYEAASPEHARPPPGHGPNNPLRPFYNASQSLLNALGRDLVARGVNPAEDAEFQRITAEKEAALRLIYFDVVQQNAEHHMRPQLDAVTQELATHGIDLQFPRITQMTRSEIVAQAKQLEQLGNYTWSNFAERHAADIAQVNAFAATQPIGLISLEQVKPDLSDWQRTSVAAGLKNIKENPDATEGVRDAAARLLTALETEPSAAFGAVLTLFQDGLTKLKVDAFPADWVTTERPGV